MELTKEDLPATIQAYELVNDKEIFIAEQVVNSQAEIETFTTRYTGKLIKAKAVAAVTNTAYGATGSYSKKRSSTTGLIMFIVILILAALIIYGFSTGWIQEKFHLKV